MLAAEKLQQWDVLYDLAKAEGTVPELILESAWRIRDWAGPEIRQFMREQIQLLPPKATPRRRIFEAFLSLARAPA